MKFPKAKQDRELCEGLPAPHPQSYEPVRFDAAGVWLALSDIHAPYHDETTIRLAVREAKRRGVTGVLLNGDTLDCHEISEHDKDPGAPRYVDELRTGCELVRWLRGQFPKAEIVAKEGNHEERLTRYVMKNAPALFGLPEVTLPHLLKLGDAGVSWVGDRRVIQLGKLCVIHGHEYGGGGGISPAGWLYRKAGYVAMCGHFHRTDMHGGADIRGKQRAAWTTGCACHLHPRYQPLNNWNQGFAIVEVAADGNFSVENRRILHGKVV